ncbi:hypothetical protein Cni_G09859 [Canna indica]|uniref:Uncharacterized protein n=1 Tax=Canna indica TaxID=4628 RepID=A0AAQ3K547_9LILI|nr:hypothetical protein Cni_G09859 [Canna indica]
MTEVLAIFVSMTGVVMTTFGKTWVADESQTGICNFGLPIFIFCNFGNLYFRHEAIMGSGLVRDLFGLLSAMTYVLFTSPWHLIILIFMIVLADYVLLKLNINMNNAVLLKKFVGEEGEEVDVQKLFGYVGLFTFVSLWWLSK